MSNAPETQEIEPVQAGRWWTFQDSFEVRTLQQSKMVFDCWLSPSASAEMKRIFYICPTFLGLTQMNRFWIAFIGRPKSTSE